MRICEYLAIGPYIEIYVEIDTEKKTVVTKQRTKYNTNLK